MHWTNTCLPHTCPPPHPPDREYPAGSTVAFSGSGEELNKNNSYPHKAGFAQPSGLAIADNGFMYVADSESSTVRAVKLDTGAVQACVGGALDPSVRAVHWMCALSVCICVNPFVPLYIILCCIAGNVYKVWGLCFCDWAKFANFHLKKCSPLNGTELILNEIAEFSSKKCSCYMVMRAYMFSLWILFVCLCLQVNVHTYVSLCCNFQMLMYSHLVCQCL